MNSGTLDLFIKEWKRFLEFILTLKSKGKQEVDFFNNISFVKIIQYTKSCFKDVNLYQFINNL
jgi:hypothetical protein